MVNSKIMTQEFVQDLRPNDEKRQDAFNEFIENGRVGQRAVIIHCGEEIKVKLFLRTKNDYGGSHPDNEIVTLRPINGGEDIALNTWSLREIDDSELVKIL